MHCLIALIFLIVPSLLHAQKKQDISLVNTSNLSFGSFSASSAGNVLIATNGLRSKTGGVVLVSASAGVAAQFTVTSTKNSFYFITLPSDGTVVLSDGNNHTMQVNSFVSNPVSSTTSIQIFNTQAQTLSIGATLVVGNLQVPGNYTGTFSVTVNY